MKKLILATVVSAFAVVSFGSNATEVKHSKSNVNVVNKTSITSNSRNENTNRNTNNQAQVQKQTQEQNQTASGGTGGQSTANGGSAANGNVSSNDSNNSSLSVSNQRSVSSAASISIIPTAVCSGVTSGGAQGASFGLSFGTSWTDTNCMLLEQVRIAYLIGETNIAAEMLCAVDAYREARIRLGIPCTGVQQPAKSVELKQYEYTDPYIRHRLGLPSLEQ